MLYFFLVRCRQEDSLLMETASENTQAVPVLPVFYMKTRATHPPDSGKHELIIRKPVIPLKE